MNNFKQCLVMDLTHGGVKIACEMTKQLDKVYAYDIYNTLKKENKDLLLRYNVEILSNLEDIDNDTLIISPVHLPLTYIDIENKINKKNNNYKFLTHHDAVKIILDYWIEKTANIPKIEITGVKGKTNSVFMLKEILTSYNPLILSSLGAMLFKNNRKFILKKNISITPASIIETVKLANRISNPTCGVKPDYKNVNYDVAIFENSLGSCGIGDIGLLTNIAENYPIANNKKTASIAKKQIFNCKKVVIEEETLSKYYKEEKIKFKDKINTYSLNKDNSDSNLVLKNVDYSLNETKIEVKYTSLKTISNKEISGNIEINTFAPGKHHVQNVLGVISACLTLDIDIDLIEQGLNNYHGINGRTSIKKIDNLNIIEEVNPGINTKAIKNSIEMINDLKDYCIIIGGQYGITCEEIDEKKLSNYLDEISENKNIILTEELGKNILNKTKRKLRFIENYNDAIDLALENNKNILFIYRSNYGEISKR
ncbi:coenzyme F430 synthase [Methanobrevibacter sp. OttesenSCG-928-K11]|nr:coenzyme F430 synthase [Methanobrevibacter sp. OttesenSCG-928-K11]MDL2270941.1 coenzyme F430 synthase [Methanobrevibacter sp. OttesenSCG-928-I08]